MGIQTYWRYNGDSVLWEALCEKLELMEDFKLNEGTRISRIRKSRIGEWEKYINRKKIEWGEGKL